MTIPVTKLEKRQHDQLNRLRNLTVGQERIWSLQRIANLTEYEADQLSDPNIAADPIDPSPMFEDALFLHRLAWDLEAIHDATHGRRPSLDAQGPRP